MWSVIQVLWLELNSVGRDGSNCRNLTSLHTTGNAQNSGHGNCLKHLQYSCCWICGPFCGSGIEGPHRMLATLVELAAKCLSIVAAVILSHNKSELPHYRQSGGKCPGKSGARPGRKVALQCAATCMSPLRLFKAIFTP